MNSILQKKNHYLGLMVEGKLMRSNRPPAKIRFKSYSNILIDFFDPKLSPDLIKIIAMIQI